MPVPHTYHSLQLKCMLTSLPFARRAPLSTTTTIMLPPYLPCKWSFPQDHATGAIRGVESYTTTCDSPHFSEVNKSIPLVIEGINLTIYVIALLKKGMMCSNFCRFVISTSSSMNNCGVFFFGVSNCGSILIVPVQMGYGCEHAIVGLCLFVERCYSVLVVASRLHACMFVEKCCLSS